ncbi:MAG: putative Ig domain-containing protein [Pseudomonadota bacterium]
MQISLIKSLTLIGIGVLISACGSGVNVTGNKPGVVPPPPTGNNAPTIGGTPATAVSSGSVYTFRPNASDADGDTLSFSIEGQPSWASFDTNSGELTGQPDTGDVGSYANIRISVSDGNETAATPFFSIDVVTTALNAALVQWQAPTTNSDGSALTDLSGFKVYALAESSRSVTIIDVDSPGVAEFRVEGLGNDTYFFSVTAYNSAGIESLISEQASITFN